KLWLWWDAEETAHLVKRSQPTLGINLVKAAESATLRWTLQAPGQTLFIHPDQCHIVISFCDTILLTQHRTFHPFRLLRSIGLILRGTVRHNGWNEEKGATNTRVFPGLLLLILCCVRRRVRDWQATQDETSVALLVQGWSGLKEMVLDTFYRTEMGVRVPKTLAPRFGLLSKQAKGDISRHLNELVGVLSDLR